MALFDEIVLSKRNRGRTSIFSAVRQPTSYQILQTICGGLPALTFFTPTSRSQQSLSADYTRVATRVSTKHFFPTSFLLTCISSTGETEYRSDEGTSHDPRGSTGIQDGYCPQEATT